MGISTGAVCGMSSASGGRPYHAYRSQSNSWKHVLAPKSGGTRHFKMKELTHVKRRGGAEVFFDIKFPLSSLTKTTPVACSYSYLKGRSALTN